MPFKCCSAQNKAPYAAGSRFSTSTVIDSEYLVPWLSAEGPLAYTPTKPRLVTSRQSGKPLWPIEERAVPASHMPGEVTWPTQPFPLKPPPFARQSFTRNDVSPFLNEEERAQVIKTIKRARNQGLFTPPDVINTIEMPGNNGGANFLGEWLSLVEHLVRDQGVGGSNPLSPTNYHA